MRRSPVAGVIFMLGVAWAPAAQAASPSQPPRWVLADAVPVRAGPSAQHAVIGSLARGTVLTLKTVTQSDGFCLVEGEGQYGFVGHGKSAVQMGGISENDDSWYRLVFVNLNGAWKVLGSDAFRYGCGC